MGSADDRMVHAEQVFSDGDKGEVVRYDRAAKWYWETTGTKDSLLRTEPVRKQISLSEAVAITLKAHYAQRGTWFRGRPGGRTLDFRVLAAIATRKGRR